MRRWLRRRTVGRFEGLVIKAEAAFQPLEDKALPHGAGGRAVGELLHTAVAQQGFFLAAPWRIARDARF